MSAINIETVVHRRQQRRFIDLPWQIYASDTCWIPPLRRAQEELLGFHPHPFYARNKTKSFLATRGGRDVGRITAIVNVGHILTKHGMTDRFGTNKIGSKYGRNRTNPFKR